MFPFYGVGRLGDPACPPPGTPRAGIDKHSYPSLFYWLTHMDPDDSILTGGWTEVPVWLRPGWWRMGKDGVAMNHRRADDRGEGGQQQPYIYNSNLLQSAHLHGKKSMPATVIYAGRIE